MLNRIDNKFSTINLSLSMMLTNKKWKYKVEVSFIT